MEECHIQLSCRNGARSWSSTVKLEFLLLLTIFHFIKKFTILYIRSVNDVPVMYTVHDLEMWLYRFHAVFYKHLVYKTLC